MGSNVMVVVVGVVQMSTLIQSLVWVPILLDKVDRDEVFWRQPMRVGLV